MPESIASPSRLYTPGMGSPAVVTVQGLRKTYGRTVAVDDVSFEVAAGEIFGLIGPNGSTCPRPAPWC